MYRRETFYHLCVPFSFFRSEQMTAQEVRLCGLLLREHFGEVVEKIGTHLVKNGAQNLRTIIHETGLSLDLVPFLHLLFLGLLLCLQLLHTTETLLLDIIFSMLYYLHIVSDTHTHTLLLNIVSWQSSYVGDNTILGVIFSMFT